MRLRDLIKLNFAWTDDTELTIYPFDGSESYEMLLEVAEDWYGDSVVSGFRDCVVILQ